MLHLPFFREVGILQRHTVIIQKRIAKPIPPLESPEKVAKKMPIPIIMELETGDPDDILAFLLALSHPRIQLKAVVMSPGTPDQIGLIRHLLRTYGKPDIPIGAFNLDHPKRSVSDWYSTTFGAFSDSRDAEPGLNIILEHCDQNTTMLCCGPMKNLGSAIAYADQHHINFQFKKVVIQGGFAGEGVVPDEDLPEKFKGKTKCPSWNLGAAISDTKRILSSSRCPKIQLVSKNVCHSVLWDETLSQKLANAQNPMIHTIDGIMRHYQEKKGHPKIIHDIVAVACALDERVCDWANVDVLHSKREGWGASINSTSHIAIVTRFHSDQFIQTLTETADSSEKNTPTASFIHPSTRIESALSPKHS